jgi:uncharacterized protein (DUF433 family)
MTSFFMYKIDSDFFNVNLNRIIRLMKKYDQLISSDYKVLLGKPVIKGTRISVEAILRKIAQGATIIDVLEIYPHLSLIQVQAAMEYAADSLANEETLVSA